MVNKKLINMLEIPSLLRLEEYRAFSSIELKGKVLDLGGDRHSQYYKFFKGDFQPTIFNKEPKVNPDIIGDLEETLPFSSASFDHILFINVLEHVFNYRELFSEATRILKPMGSIVIIVPFLFPEHPSPEDFRRFTANALRKEASLLNLRVESLIVLGRGVFSAIYLFIDRLLPNFLRWINFYTLRYVVYFLDYLISLLANVFGKKYNKDYYALGYCMVARKNS